MKLKRTSTRLERVRVSVVGFTLIELLVVMAVMIILATLMLKGFGFLAGESKSKACYAKMARIGSAMDEYFRDTGRWTDNMNLLVPKYLDAPDLIDPWGTPFIISFGSGVGGYNNNERQRAASLGQQVAAGGGPFSITSYGPNRMGDSVHVGRDDLMWPYQ